jgi:hypothetical protein
MTESKTDDKTDSKQAILDREAALREELRQMRRDTDLRYRDLAYILMEAHDDAKAELSSVYAELARVYAVLGIVPDTATDPF